MKKILEFKNQDWQKGTSLYPNLAGGGLFQVLLNCDPFDPANGGLAQPSLTPDSQGTGIATTPKFLTSFNSSGTDYIYAHSDTKLYRVLKDSPYTVSDQTAQIWNGVTPTHTLGKVVWRNYYIYAYQTAAGAAVRSNVFPVASGSDTVITPSGFPASGSLDNVPFCVGADGNLYMGDYQQVYIITSGSGTSGNIRACKIEDGLIVRDLINDGRYLVILADNNTIATASRKIGNYKCKIYFWDMTQTDGNGYLIADAAWDVKDSYLIGGQLTDGGIEFFGYKGIYATTVMSQPKMIRPFNNSNLARMGRPLNPYQITYAGGSLYWVDGSTNTSYYIYAYGNPITGQRKAFYIPYQTGVNGISQTLISSGVNFILANDEPKLYFFNVGSTRGTLQVTSIDTNMEMPVEYGYTKIVLGQKLASGQQVQVNVYGNGGQDLISSEIKTYAQVGAKQTLKFNRTPTTTNQPTKAEDYVITISSSAPLQRVSVYGTPQDDANVDL